MITNADVQGFLNDDKKLDEIIVELKDIKQGSGDLIIHKYAFKALLLEIQALRAIS